MNTTIRRLIEDSIKAKQQLLEPAYIGTLEKIGQAIVDAYRNDRKVLVFGNGGSAADAQHFAAELVCRFQKNRAALPALALTANIANLTAIGNDFNFDDIFSRQLEAFCRPGDVVIAISTSGNSPNVLKALEEARRKKAITVGFTGGTGGKMNDKLDISFCAPSTVTARIQECHLLAIHILCSLVEDALFGEK